MPRARTPRTANYAASKTRRTKARRASVLRMYQNACRCAARGDFAPARATLERLVDTVSDSHLMALVKNDLATLAAVAGDTAAAIKGFRAALAIDLNCQPARLNLALLEADRLVECGGSRAAGQTGKGEDETQQAKDEHGRELRVECRTTTEQVERGEVRAGSQTELPRCLLLMVTYNRLEYTHLAVDALLNLDYPNLRIVVWDNASTDGTVDWLRSRLAGIGHVRLILSPTNMGVVYPMNAVWGSEHVAELLAKVDNDTLVPPDLIRRLADCHKRSHRFGVLSGFHFRKEGEQIANEKDLVSDDGVHVLRQHFVGGCAVAVRREVVEQFGSIPCRVTGPSVPLSPHAGRGGNGPILESGWTQYQQRLAEAGLINGYPWPPVHVDHMEDTRSPWCVRSQEHENYKRAMRGMSLDEFTRELCVWRPH